MRSLRQFVLFQVLWCVAVLGAARGQAWWGALALVPYLVAECPAAARGAWLARVLAAGAAGSLLDSLLAALGVLRHPLAPVGWPAPLVPPFIAVLWIAFATLPRVSLAWLAPRPGLAALLGAVGGPLSFAAGVRTGAVGVGESSLVTYAWLALEYALATPLLLAWLGPGRAPTAGARSRASPGPDPGAAA